ncbi:hypothetical protein SLA2020_352720 [Shorea laevis]
MNPWKLLSNITLKHYRHHHIFIPMPNVDRTLIVGKWIFKTQRIKLPLSKSNYNVTVQGLVFSLLSDLYLRITIDKAKKPVTTENKAQKSSIQYC